jgi:hypothetical protein
MKTPAPKKTKLSLKPSAVPPVANEPISDKHDEIRSLRNRILSLEGLIAVHLGDNMGQTLAQIDRRALAEKAREFRAAIRKSPGNESSDPAGHGDQ